MEPAATSCTSSLQRACRCFPCLITGHTQCLGQSPSSSMETPHAGPQDATKRYHADAAEALEQSAMKVEKGHVMPYVLYGAKDKRHLVVSRVTHVVQQCGEIPTPPEHHACPGASCLPRSSMMLATQDRRHHSWFCILGATASTTATTADSGAQESSQE